MSYATAQKVEKSALMKDVPLSKTSFWGTSKEAMEIVMASLIYVELVDLTGYT